jgi:hypothetical protein
MREAEERAKAKAAEAAVAAAQEAEEAKRRWKEEARLRVEEKKRKQQQQPEAAAAGGAGRIEVEEVEEPTGELPLPLASLAGTLVGDGGGKGSGWKALLAALFVLLLAAVAAVGMAALAAGGAGWMQQLQQPQSQQQQLQQQAPPGPTTGAALVVPAPVPFHGVARAEVGKATAVASYDGDKEVADAGDAACAGGDEDGGMSWAGVAMAAAQAAVKAVTHRDFTRTPLYQAGGKHFAELAAVVHYWGDGEDGWAADEEDVGPLAEMLLEAWMGWEDAAGHEEWDVPRLAAALSSARVSAVKPIRPRKRGAPSVNTGAIKARAEARRLLPAAQFDPVEEAAEMVLERRLARRPMRRRPLAVRIVLAPFKLAVGIVKLPFRVAFGVLKVVSWPVRAALRM